MKTAVLISGHMRTFKRCLPNQHWFAYRKLPNPSFFVSCVDDEDAESAELLRNLYPDVFIEKVVQPTLPEKNYAIMAHFAPYECTPSKTPGVTMIQGFLRAFWHLARAWEFLLEHKRGDFDLVMWSRGDLHFHRYDLPSLPLGNLEAFTTWWGLYGGANTSGGLYGIAAAEAVFNTFKVLDELIAEGCPFHPETLALAAMERAGVTVHHTLAADFAFMRKEGPHHMLVTPQEMARYSAELVLQKLKS